jgi:hypothetical protein
MMVFPNFCSEADPSNLLCFEFNCSYKFFSQVQMLSGTFKNQNGPLLEDGAVFGLNEKKSLPRWRKFSKRRLHFGAQLHSKNHVADFTSTKTYSLRSKNMSLILRQPKHTPHVF